MEQKELAGCAIFNEQRELLLIHRNRRDLTQWELPGGKVEPGETLGQTAVRETLEELGVEVKLVCKIGKADFEYSGINWSYTWFEASITSGKPEIREPHTFDQFAYWNIGRLREMNDLSSNVTNLLKVIK